MTKHAKLLWVDLEMTGLDPHKDRILEVAAIATDWNFKEYATCEAVIHQPPKVLAGMDEWCRAQHGASGLTERVQGSKVTGNEAETMLIKLVEEHFKSGNKVILAGNSIHMDRRFIIHHWAKLDEKLHYRMLDVSAWKVVFEGKYRQKFTKPEQHRALEDIRGSVEELRHYLGKVKAQ